MVLEVKKPRPMWEILFSTHHTDIGLLYMMTSIAFLMIGGALALAIRSELFLPGQQIFQSPNDFERFFTVHGTTMLAVMGYSFWSWYRKLPDSNYGQIQRYGVA